MSLHVKHRLLNIFFSKYINRPDAELYGFEREGKGRGFIYMSKTKILYIKFLLLIAGLFYLFLGGGGLNKGVLPT